jgi:hypothetical protein
MRRTIYEEPDCLREKNCIAEHVSRVSQPQVFPAFWKYILKTISASQNKVSMVKFVINCMLNIQTKHKLFSNVN